MTSIFNSRQFKVAASGSPKFKIAPWLLLILLTGCIPASLRAQGINIGPGANMIVSGPLKIFINNGSLVNEGGFVPDGSTVIFTGSAPANHSAIGGSSWLPFNNLTIAKSSGDVLLATSSYVASNLRMQSGNLLLNGFNMDLGNTGLLIGESSSSQVFGTNGGTLSCYTFLSNPAAEDPANLGIEITSSSYMGETVLFRGNDLQTLDGSTASIYRYFDIFPSVNTGLNASVKLRYQNAELAGMSKSSLNMWYSPDYGVDWNFSGLDSSDTIHNWVYKTGFDSLARYTLGPALSPAAASLTFGGRLVGSQAHLNWVVTSNPLADHFELERSEDGSHFSKLSDIPAYAIRSRSDAYHSVDPYPLDGLSYYRLKEVNRGDKFVYTRTIAIKTGIAILYPNPVRGILTIQVSAGSARQILLRLYNAGGQLAGQKSVDCQPGINNILWDLSGLAAGAYTVDFGNLPVAARSVIVR